MILGIDFNLRGDLEGYDTIPIEILTGPYRNVIFRVVSVSIKEIGDEVRMGVEYKLIEHPNFREHILREDNIFTQTVGLIVNTIVLDLQEDIDESTDRKNYSEELDT